METKRNVKYFTSPPISVLALVGWGIVLIGAILLSARYLRLWGVVTIIVGLGLVVATSGRKSTDTDIEFQVSERIRNLQELSEKKFEVYEKNFLKMLRPINLRGYDFEKKEEPFYYRKGNDGQHRTNYFTGANLKTLSRHNRNRLSAPTAENINSIFRSFYKGLDNIIRNTHNVGV